VIPVDEAEQANRLLGAIPTNSMKVLLAEDDRKIANFIRNGLKEFGFVAETVANGESALTLILEQHFDAVVLDVMLPGCDGLSILRALRARSNAVPVLLLTARGQLSEKIEGLNLGADDYLAKPFFLEELAARLRALTRRGGSSHLASYRVDNLVLDVASRTAHRGTRRIELTNREFSLLETMMRDPGRVFTRTQLYQRVWEYQFDTETNLIDVYIQRLRRKVDDGEPRKILHTVRGVGYRVGETR
jgi:DNA-binding response OmpR family regulator